MRNLQLILCFLLITSSLLAQRDRFENLQNFDKYKIHFGFYLGVNKNDFKINYKKTSINPNVKVDAETGFSVGLIVDLLLYKNINLRFEPGLIGNSEKELFFGHIEDMDNNNERTVKSTYLHLPLVLKFSTNRMRNIRPYILSGISYDYNFESNEKNENDNSKGTFRTKANNFMYELGIGIDVYFYFFKFSPSIRGSFALNNELKYDNDTNSRWTSPINFLGTRGVFLTLAFEGLL